MFQKYREAGLCVIPLKSGVPQVKWAQYQHALPDDVKPWEKYKEYALVCGAISGVIALDFDTDDKALIDKIESLAGVSPIKKVGSKGFTAFYKYNGEKTQSWGAVVELLSDKHLTTLPPSKHRSKDLNYKWVDHELLGATLPTLAPQFSQLMDVLYPPPTYKQQWVTYERHVELAEVEKMMVFLSPDCSRQEWVEIGMALKDEFGDIACNLWHSWSAGSSKYKQKDAQNAWRSFTRQGITIGTLIHKAKQHGFEFEIKQVCEIGGVQSVGVEGKEIRATGLVGEIADWITATAVKPQPTLSLAAALAFVAMLKGHKICGATGLRTNILALSLAPTGGGKEYPQDALNRLANACGVSKHIMGEPVSGGGFLTGLLKANRVSLLVMDEMGRYISNIASKSAASHQKEIIDYIIKTFSRANGVLRGRQYVDEKKNPCIDVSQPHFCCIGSTVQERLQSSFTSSEVVDGFLPRWLVFEAGRVKRSEKQTSNAIPDRLVKAIVDYVANPIKYDNYGEPLPKTVRFTPEAWDVFVSFRSEMDDTLEKVTYPLDKLYSRAAEHVEKLALIFCDDEFIGVQDVKLAIQIVEQSNLAIMRFANLIADNVQEQDFIRVREKIKEEGEIKRSVLTYRCQFVQGGAKRIAEIIEVLKNTDTILERISGNKTYYKWNSW